MAYNGRLLARARGRLSDIREENSREQQRRLAEVYARLPSVRLMDAQLRGQMAELAGLTLRRDLPGIARLEKENLALQARREQALRDAGFSADYTDEIFSCPLCRDMGMRGVEICSCLRRLYNHELTEELGTLVRCGDESFENFDLGLYDGGSATSPRELMRLVLVTCRAYAENFGPGSESLLFQGGTGLGKTYLSACIARVVAEKGYSVAYETAASALGAFESRKFSRDAQEAAAAEDRVRQYLGCDLMILDDLGTEMNTSFSASALYTLVNERLVAGKQTIISTNCTDEELHRRYSAQIMSRIDGEYLKLRFAGRDIRLIRKERST